MFRSQYKLSQDCGMKSALEELELQMKIQEVVRMTDSTT